MNDPMTPGQVADAPSRRIEMGQASEGLAGIDDAGFIEPVPMEQDPSELFAGDCGVLEPEVRRVLVRLLQRRFLLAGEHPKQWKILLANQHVITSRLNDLFVQLVVDHDRGVAYKKQVRSQEIDVPILLKDDAYSRAETLVLVQLRAMFQRERTAGESTARVDIEELEQTVLTFFGAADHDMARNQDDIRKALVRLEKDGIVKEESQGRFRISPLVEIVMSAEKLTELRQWLRDQAARAQEPQS